MRKRLLFVDKSLDVGGIQTSMINMMNSLIKLYDIDLFLYHTGGILTERLDKRITVIGADGFLESCGMSFSECLKRGTVKQRIYRICMTGWCKLFDNRFPLWVAFHFQKKLSHYDVAIAYHHETEKKTLTSGFARFAKSCVDADRYVSWIHNDALANPIDESFNEKYYRQMDGIVCVSEGVREHFVTRHPTIDKNMVTVCCNFLDFARIGMESDEEPTIRFDKTKFNCFSACRLTKVKGIPRAIDALGDIIKEYDIHWYIAGEGNEREAIERAVADHELGNHVFLMGEQKDPYPYMRQADLILSTSFFEAAPMLYSEARFLKRPVFSTRTASTDEMLQNGRFGIVCENSVEGIRNSFRELMEHRERLIAIVTELQQEVYSEQRFINEFHTAIIKM